MPPCSEEGELASQGHAEDLGHPLAGHMVPQTNTALVSLAAL